MRNMKLKCVAKGCEWECQELNEGLAKDTLVMHLQLVHQIEPAQPQVGGAITIYGREIQLRWW